MNAPQDHDPGLLAGGGVAAVVIRNKEEILRRFCDRAQRSLPSARREPHPVIVDTLPAFITRLAMALRAIDDLEYASKSSNIAVQHGDERARFTQYSLGDLLKEYQFIREILMDVLRTQSAPTDEQWRVMHRSVDEAMAEAATAFVEVHDGFREVFTASLTHDFRGPLSNARNFVELMRRATGAAQREQFALRATQNLDRIARMIAGLLDASRSNVGERLAVDAAECDVGDLLNEVLVDLEPGVRQRVELTMPEDTSAYWDRDKIHRAVQNLVDNAIKYSAQDSPCELTAGTDGDHVLFSVRDYEIGIEPDEQNRIFERFYQVDSSSTRTYRGTGLGLSLVREVLEKLGGTIEVESSPGRGSRFTVRLPVQHPRLYAADERTGIVSRS
jgi:signal transduction histidine kinase